MSGGIKRRAILALLLVVALWPLLHRVLVARYDLNPWKFFGFAMYCVPTLEPQLRLHVDYGGRVEVLDVSQPDFARVRAEIEVYQHDRGVWGDLATPDRVAAAVFEVLTRPESVEVEVIDPYFDRETARIAAKRPRYRYPRDAD